MTRSRTLQRRAQGQRNMGLWLLGIFGIAILVVAALLVANASAPPPAVTNIASSGRVWGSATAPVTIEIYSDFQ